MESRTGRNQVRRIWNAKGEEVVGICMTILMMVGMAGVMIIGFAEVPGQLDWRTVGLILLKSILFAGLGLACGLFLGLNLLALRWVIKGGD